MDGENRGRVLQEVQGFVIHGSYRLQLLPCGPNTPAALEILYLGSSENLKYRKSLTVLHAPHRFGPEVR